MVPLTAASVTTSSGLARISRSVYLPIQEPALPSTVEQLNPSRVKLTVEIPFADLKPHLDKAYREIASQVSIPGFRKGKVPNLVIDQRFGRAAVLQEAINAALPAAYEAAIIESEIVPLGEPAIEVTKLEDGDVVEFTAETDVRPEITVPDFAKLKATVESLREVDAEVDERIELLRRRFATSSEVDRAAADGDQVVIDLVGTRDGEPLEDASAEGVSYVLGSGGMIDGLEEAVIGLKAGDTAEFSSTLVGGAFEGEPADITVTVKKVNEQKLPELDDEFASMISEFDTVEEMKADLTTAVEQMLASEQQAEGRNKILEALVAAAKLELPETFLSSQLAAQRSQIETQLAQAGLTLERYLAQSQDEAGTPEEFWKRQDEGLERALKAQLILDKIAEDNEVTTEQSDLTQLIVSKAAANGTSPEQELQHMMEHGHANEWLGEIRRNKALALVLEKAKVVDAAGKAVTLAAPTAAETLAEE